MATNLAPAFKPKPLRPQGGAAGSGVATAYHGDGSVDAANSGVFHYEGGVGDRHEGQNPRDRVSYWKQRLREARSRRLKATGSSAVFAPTNGFDNHRGKSVYYTVTAADLARLRAGVERSHPDAAGQVPRITGSFGGNTQVLNGRKGDVQSTLGGDAFNFGDSPGYKLAEMRIDGVPVSPEGGDGSDPELGIMNDQIRIEFLRASTQGPSVLRAFLDEGRSTVNMIRV